MAIINQIQFRRGADTEWSAVNNGEGPILASGEPGFDLTNNLLKIGDGTNNWKDLNPIGTDQNLYKVKNVSGGIIYKGQAVCASGTVGNSDAIQVIKFIGDGSIPEYSVMGLASQQMADNEFGYVTAFGQIRHVDTRGLGLLGGNLCDGNEGWADGEILYASSSVSGKLTKIKPQHDTILAIVLSSGTNGSLFVRPSWNPHIDDLHDVNTSGVNDKNYLRYNSSNSTWVPTSTGTFSKTYTNELFMTPSGENISASHLKLYQYPDQPTSLLQLNQSNLQIIGVSGSSLSPQDPTKYPQISFNKLSYVDFNRSAIRLTACETTGGNAGPSWPTVTGISSQAMSSGIFFEDRLWKPSSYNPANGFAYDATSQIVSTPSNTVAGYTKLSFLVQTASGVVNPNNGTVPPGSYVERFYIGSDGITNVNGTIRANQGEMDSLVLDEGGLTVNRGIIQVNNSFDNNFVMMINSSGLNISASYEFITDYADSANSVTPVQLFDTPSITPSTITVLFDGLTEEDLTVNKTVLIRSASNSIKNGIYIIAAGSAANTIRFNRHPSYPNGSTVKNGKVFGVRSNGGSYVLNIQLPLNEDRIINTDTLDFSPFGGSRAVTFTANADAAFSAAVYAKEKYFRIQHPDPESSYEYLQYGSLESPYHGVRLTGEGELKNGTCTIKLPTYLKHLIHDKDINIQLTNKGHHKILYLDKIDLKNDRFIVKGYRSKTGGPFAFFWCFTGVRKDVDPLIPEY